MKTTLEDHEHWPKTYMMDYISFDHTTTRQQDAFYWIRQNVTTYKLRRGEGIDYTIYIKDPKEMTLFMLKFADVCLTEEQSKKWN